MKWEPVNLVVCQTHCNLQLQEPGDFLSGIVFFYSKTEGKAARERSLVVGNGDW